MSDARFSVLDSYSHTYAFTLVPFALALVAMRAYPAYGYDHPGYVLLLTAPPVLGLFAALLAERSGRSLRSTLGRTVLLASLSVLGSATLFTLLSLLLVPLSRFFTPQNFGALTVGALGVLGVVSLPLAVTLVRELARRTPGVWLRAAVLVLALAGIVGVVLVTVGSHAMVDTLRKDQVVQLMAGLVWYLPTYGLAAALWRSTGLGA